MRKLVATVTVFYLFALSAQSFDLKCSFNYMSWNHIGHLQTCQVTSLSVTTPNQTITTVNGQTTTYPHITAFSISYQTANYLPKGIDKFFPNLDGIRVDNSKLRAIEHADLKPFKNLKELQLNNNELHILENDLFQSSPELRYILFNYNNLMIIGQSLLDPIKKLEQIHFSSCSCVNFAYSNSLQYYRPSIKEALKKCESSEEFKKILCEKDIDELKGEILELQQENFQLKTKLTGLFESCDGNLDAATRNLLSASKRIETCAKDNTKTRTSLSEEQGMIVTCHEYNSLNESCTAKNFMVKSANTTIEAVEDDEGVDIAADSIANLFVDVQQALFLPSNIADFFAQLKVLSVTTSGLFQISSDTFEGLAQLTSLDLSNNKVMEIPSDAFNDLLNLLEMNLSKNKLEKLEIDVFKSLENLQTLKLNDNFLLTINVEVFETLKNLKQLSLQNNKLKFISANLLSPFNKIEAVDFSENVCINMSHPKHNLAQITSTIIDNCIAPIDLNCKFEAEESVKVDEKSSEVTLLCNAHDLKIDYPKTKILKLSGVHAPDFNVNNLTTFIAKDQSLKFLPFELAKSFPKLEKIVIESSKLTTLQKNDFSGFAELRRIEISHNNLSTIDDKVFDDVLQLEYLDLSHNNIHTLPTKIFFHLVQLKTLILSHNEIEKFVADLLPRKNAIEKVLIDHNQLDMIETKTLRYLRRAKQIDLTANVCIDLKFDKADNSSKTLIELSGEIDLNCSDDD